jgi:hypothetical protein
MDQPMDKPRRQPHSYLFTVSVWCEELGNGEAEWRGRLKNVETGEERAFRKWHALIDLIQDMLPAAKIVAVE